MEHARRRQQLPVELQLMVLSFITDLNTAIKWVGCFGLPCAELKRWTEAANSRDQGVLFMHADLFEVYLKQGKLRACQQLIVEWVPGIRACKCRHVGSIEAIEAVAVHYFCEREVSHGLTGPFYADFEEGSEWFSLPIRDQLVFLCQLSYVLYISIADDDIKYFRRAVRAVHVAFHSFSAFIANLFIEYLLLESAANGNLKRVQFLAGYNDDDRDLSSKDNQIAPNDSFKKHDNNSIIQANTRLLCYFAAHGGQLHILKWARQMSIYWNERICSLAAFRNDLEMLQWARDNGCRWDSSTTTVAARKEHFDLLMWVIKEGCPVSSEAATALVLHAIENQDIDALRVAHNMGGRLNKDHLTFAAFIGDLSIMEWLIEKDCPRKTNKILQDVVVFFLCGWQAVKLNYSVRKDCPWTDRALQKAAECSKKRKEENDNLSILDWLLKNGCTLDDTTFVLAVAATTGSSKAILYAQDRYSSTSNTESIDAIDTNFNKIADFSILEWLQRQNCRQDSTAIKAAIKGKSASVVKWCFDHDPLAYVWKEDKKTLLRIAIESNHAGLLETLVAKGMNFWELGQSFVHMDEKTDWACVKIAYEAGFKINQALRRQLCAREARKGELENLQWSHKSNFGWDSQVTAAAAEGGHLNVLQWLRSNGCPWDARVCAGAAKAGRLDILLWARANKCPWNALLSASACEAGHLDILQWARANKSPIHSNSSLVAAKAGQFHILEWLLEKRQLYECNAYYGAVEAGRLDVVQWLHARSCDMDVSVSSIAAEKGHLAILQWLRANNCPWNTGVCKKALRGGHLELLKWAIENGCPHPWVENDDADEVEGMEVDGVNNHKSKDDQDCDSDSENDSDDEPQGHLQKLSMKDKKNAAALYLCREACKEGKFDLVKLAHSIGVCDDPASCTIASEQGHKDIHDWLKAHGHDGSNRAKSQGIGR